LLLVALDALVMEGDAGELGEVDDVADIVAGRGVDGAEVEQGGEQDDSVEAHPEAALHVLGETGGAHTAVGFAEDELRRVPAIVLGDPAADEVADRLDIAAQPVELGRLGAALGTAVAGGHRVDQDDVGGVEDAVGVVDHGGRWLWRRGAVFRDVNSLGAEYAEVEPDRGRPGATVEGEEDRAGGGVLDVAAEVGDVEDRGAGFSVVGFEEQGGGLGGVGDRLAADGDFSLGGDGF
jgi:hypothetical protein